MRAIFALALILASSPAGAFVSAPALGPHWHRTGEVVLRVGDNVDASWRPYLVAAIARWNAVSARTHITLVLIPGTSSAATCPYVTGTVQICAAAFGKNGSFGYSNWLASGTKFFSFVVRLNNSYAQSAERKTYTVAHELGHALGLAHNDAIRTNPNTGSVMDYTNSYTGVAPANAPLSDLYPTEIDFAEIEALHAGLDPTQLPQTLP